MNLKGSTFQLILHITVKQYIRMQAYVHVYFIHEGQYSFSYPKTPLMREIFICTGSIQGGIKSNNYLERNSTCLDCFHVVSGLCMFYTPGKYLALI